MCRAAVCERWMRVVGCRRWGLVGRGGSRWKMSSVSHAWTTPSGYSFGDDISEWARSVPFHKFPKGGLYATSCTYPASGLCRDGRIGGICRCCLTGRNCGGHATDGYLHGAHSGTRPARHISGCSGSGVDDSEATATGVQTTSHQDRHVVADQKTSKYLTYTYGT